MGVGLPKGYAYVEMESGHDAEKAVKGMNGGQIDGNTLKVEFQADKKRKAAEESKRPVHQQTRRPPVRTDRDRERERDRERRERERERSRRRDADKKRDSDHKDRDRRDKDHEKEKASERDRDRDRQKEKEKEKE